VEIGVNQIISQMQIIQLLNIVMDWIISKKKKKRKKKIKEIKIDQTA